MKKTGKLFGALLACLLPLAASLAHGAEDAIRVGVIAELSGSNAFMGKQTEAGIKTYMQQFGDTVAGKKIQLIYKDTGGNNPSLSKQLATELIVKDKVDVITGLGFTPNALSIAPVLSESQKPGLIMLAATSVITSKSPYFVRFSYTLPQVSLPMGQWAGKRAKNNVYALVADYGPGNDALEYFKRGFLASGGKLAGEVKVPLNSLDFAPYLQRIRDTRPDAIFVFLPAGQSIISFIKTYAEKGLAKDGIGILATEGWADEDVLAAVGDAAVGAISSGYYSTDHRSAKNKEFLKAFNAANGDSELHPNFITVAAYDAMAGLYEAARQLKGDLSDGNKVLSVLKSLKLDSPRGPLSIDPDTRDPIQTVYFRRVEKDGGKLINREFDKYENVKDPAK